MRLRQKRDSVERAVKAHAANHLGKEGYGLAQAGTRGVVQDEAGDRIRPVVGDRDRAVLLGPEGLLPV